MNQIPEESHCMQCELDHCIVCSSRLEELRDTWDWVWFLVVTNTDYPNPENKSLTDYE